MNEEPGYAPRTAQLVARLRRIEGQVRGLQRLVEEGVIEKQKKPAGYIVKQSSLFE